MAVFYSSLHWDSNSDSRDNHEKFLESKFLLVDKSRKQKRKIFNLHAN